MRTPRRIYRGLIAASHCILSILFRLQPYDMYGPLPCHPPWFFSVDKRHDLLHVAFATDNIERGHVLKHSRCGHSDYSLATHTLSDRDRQLKFKCCEVRIDLPLSATIYHINISVTLFCGPSTKLFNIELLPFWFCPQDLTARKDGAKLECGRLNG